MINKMHICLECGGKLKLVAKPGRMVWDGEDLFEIPAELKISACVECGQPFEDAFIRGKINNAVKAQKRMKHPPPRLLYLRWIDNFLDNMFKRPSMYGDVDSVYGQTILCLSLRELILAKGSPPPHRKIADALHLFMQKRWPQLGSNCTPEGISLNDEFAPALKEFCDVWIHATV